MEAAPIIHPSDLFIVICDEYQDAQDCFDFFVEWLEHNNSWCIMFADPFSNRVRTTDGFTYIFIEYRATGLFSKYWEGFISKEEFFEGMSDDAF